MMWLLKREVTSLSRHGLLDRLAEHRTPAFLIHSSEPPFVSDPLLQSAYMLDPRNGRMG